MQKYKIRGLITSLIFISGIGIAFYTHKLVVFITAILASIMKWSIDQDIYNDEKEAETLT